MVYVTNSIMDKKFLSNWLSNVKFNYSKSLKYPAALLVPQRTKLAPILYNLYCDDVVNNYRYANVKMNADDLNAHAVVSTDNGRIKF